MAINWANLRTWNGNQDGAFEELCCQLAASEDVPTGARFFRKGTPDAGVECFWQLPNGDQLAWQAKLFHQAPQAAQWKQIDQSVEQAIAKHPRLTRYTVCLPIDLPDARVGRQKSALEKWHDRVAKWEQTASANGMSVSFEYWGQHEIGTRLSDEKHRGRHWFWFNEECLSNAWFTSHVEEAVSNAGDRYAEDLNIDLPVRHHFDALGRTPALFERVRNLYSGAAIASARLCRGAQQDTAAKHEETIAQTASELLAVLEPWIASDTDYTARTIGQPMPWDDVRRLARDLLMATDNGITEVRALKDRRKRAH